MFFLDRKTDTDQPYYMVVSPNRGYLRDIGGVATPFGAEDQWLLDVAGRPFDVLSDQLAQVRARP